SLSSLLLLIISFTLDIISGFIASNDILIIGFPFSSYFIVVIFVISANALCSIEQGESFPEKNTIIRICKALEIPESYLLLFSISAEDIPENKRILYNALCESIKEDLIHDL
ncbi:helix-turn-helix domain-containing protein, partial [Bacteroides nordii]|uniref:helix-turn-helix domain-containing protein n=1 Tax=Bacteroides nordii TaxID=291645 RepID=UPI00241CD342